MASREVFAVSESAAWVWTRCKCSRSWNNVHTKSPTPGQTVCCDTGVETEGDDWICILFVTLHSKVSPFVSRLLNVDLSWGELLRCAGSTERTTMPELFEKEPQPSSASVSFAAAVQLIPPTERFLMNLASLWLPNANTHSYHTARSKALIGCYSIFSCWLQREREHRVSLCEAADMTSSVLAALLRSSN